MKQFHVICGLPRSGSTLLCNVLNQNPDFYASSTSVMAQTLGGISNLWSQSPEITAERLHDAQSTDERMVRSVRALIKGWYADQEGIVFDKGRGWAHHALAIKQIFPQAKIIVTVRDLRAVFGSIEKQHRKNPMLDHAVMPVAKGIYTRADQMFSPEGVIGAPLHGVLDLLRRQPDDLIVVQYETLVQQPGLVMERLYAELGQKMFAHDFENVENTSRDIDGLYMDKFPHEGSGKIVPVDRNEWQKFVSADVSQSIMGAYPLYNQMLGYA